MCVYIYTFTNMYIYVSCDLDQHRFSRTALSFAFKLMAWITAFILSDTPLSHERVRERTAYIPLTNSLMTKWSMGGV